MSGSIVSESSKAKAVFGYLELPETARRLFLILSSLFFSFFFAPSINPSNHSATKLMEGTIHYVHTRKDPSNNGMRVQFT